MRAIVTAGGTSEPIDDVRVVTNLSTGRFGAALATALADRGVDVVLIASRSLCQRPHDLDPRVRVVPFGSTEELKVALWRETARPPELLFMAAAVSDYAPRPVHGKIRSVGEQLSVSMDRTPKILPTLRERCGDGTRICGFKLLSRVSSEALIGAAREQLAAAHTDLCLANDLAELGRGLHPAWIVTEDEALRVEGSKARTASALASFALRDAPGHGEVVQPDDTVTIEVASPDPALFDPLSDTLDHHGRPVRTDDPAPWIARGWQVVSEGPLTVLRPPSHRAHRMPAASIGLYDPERELLRMGHRNASHDDGSPPVSDRYGPWRERLQAIRAADHWRVLRRLVPTSPTTARLGGREVIVACSNDYLGLARHPEVMRAARGGGSGGSRLISGSHDVHHRLEEALEDWLERPCLLFNSGWNANLAVGSTLCTAGQRVGSDALNHASLIDGLRLGRAERVVLPHADPDAIPDDLDLIVVEGLFSMDGDRPPLHRYPRRPWLLVDEAHAIGCVGPGGRGVAADQGVAPDVVVGTFGKAFGAAGAFVCGPPELKELLVNTARSFLFTTALPEPVAHMVLAALPLADEAARQRLRANVRRLRTGLAQQGLSVMGTDHIVPVVVGSRALALSAALLERGVYAPAIRWPTVPRGEERLRLTVSAAHSEEQLDHIVEALGALGGG